jgi:DnaK suppressor protein
MDESRARELLDRERARIESALAAIEGAGPAESDENWEPGDEDSEDLYQDEFDEGRRDEERLAAGTYGLSVESGEPIPDSRLEAVPLAERTVQEEGRYRRS